MNENISKYFEESYDFINVINEDRGNKINKILVHCKQGVSRSASFVIAYFIRKYGRSYDDSYKTVKDKRNKMRFLVGKNYKYIDSGDLNIAKEFYNKTPNEISREWYNNNCKKAKNCPCALRIINKILTAID